MGHPHRTRHSREDQRSSPLPLDAEWPSGMTLNVGIDPSKVQIVKLKLDKDRKALLEKKKRKGTAKGKFTDQDIQAIQDVD